MKTKLGNIAGIHTGVFARTVPEGNVVYLQARHFNENGELHADLHPDLKEDERISKHLLQHGDVLFVAKGNKNFASWYEVKNPPAVASTSFFVIRLNNNFLNKVVPEFLVWTLNQPMSQQYFKSKARGTSMVSISKGVLEDLEIAIPDLKTQQTVLSIVRLRSREKELIQKIEALKEQKIQYQIIQSIFKL